MENQIDQSDYLEAAALGTSGDGVYASACKGPAPCKSCGGGCYGCKGSRAAEVSLEGKESALKEIVESILD